jgi:hypothetical protein
MVGRPRPSGSLAPASGSRQKALSALASSPQEQAITGASTATADSNVGGLQRTSTDGGGGPPSRRGEQWRTSVEMSLLSVVRVHSGVGGCRPLTLGFVLAGHVVVVA